MSPTFAIQSRIASLVASFSVRVPNSTGAHLRAEQPHPLDVGRLPAHVLAAHVDDALEAEARADRGGRDAVLAGAGLGDDALLAEPARDHRLAERVVQLVRAGVQQVLALQVHPPVGREALDARQRRRPAGVGREQLVELGEEGVVLAQRRPRPLRARRARGSASRARSARRTRRRCVQRHRAASTHASDRVVVLDARLDRSVDRAESTAHGATAAIASATLSGPSPPASITRPPVARARSRCVGSLLGPRQVDDRPDALAASQEHRVARAVPVLALVELDDVGVGLLGLADEHRDAQHGVGRVEQRVGAARALGREDEARPSRRPPRRRRRRRPAASGRTP